MYAQPSTAETFFMVKALLEALLKSWQVNVKWPWPVWAWNQKLHGSTTPKHALKPLYFSAVPANDRCIISDIDILRFVLKWHPCNMTSVSWSFSGNNVVVSVVFFILFEPAHEIIALFILRKFILQTRICSHPVELDVWFLVGPFVYFHTSCVRTAKALARLRGCAGSPKPSLVAHVISTIRVG